MIAIIDYGVGNLFSLSSSLSYLGLDNRITNKKEEIISADRIILPGVGAFADAAEKLRKTGLVDTIKEETAAGKPLLGICLGMQLLFDRSFEYGECQGLGLISGEICPLQPDLNASLKVPHIGWNSLRFTENAFTKGSESSEIQPWDVSLHPLLKYSKDGDYVYYVHSYYGKNCAGSTLAVSGYDVEIPGLVGSGNVFGAQFHPEKSGFAGLSMLRAFAEL